MKAIVKFTIATVVVLCLSLGFFSEASLASVIVNWSFDQPTGVAGPTDILTLNATLTNDISSTSNLTYFGNYGGALMNFGTFFPSYSYVFGTGSGIFGQLGGIDLAPGESYSFIFGTLTPIGTTPDGTYKISDAFMYFDSVAYHSSNSFERTIGSSSVPEPATMLLFGAGLAGLGIMRKRMKV